MKAIPTILSLTLFLALPSCDSSRAADNDSPPSGEHQSSTIIQILPSDPPAAAKDLRSDNYIANEIASLSMGIVTEFAAKELKDISASDIQKSLKVDRISGTDMARITAFSDDSSQPKRILEELISSYMKIRKLTDVGREKRALDALDSELIAQSDKVQDHRKDLTVLIQQYGIPYFDGADAPLGKTELELYAAARKKYADLSTELNLLKAKFGVLEEDKAEREALIPQIKILEAQVQMLGEIADDRQNDTVDLSLKQHTYIQAKDTLLLSRNMLLEMKARQQEARIALKMPRDPLIIRQKAD